MVEIIKNESMSINPNNTSCMQINKIEKKENKVNNQMEENIIKSNKSEIVENHHNIKQKESRRKVEESTGPIFDTLYINTDGPQFTDNVTFDQNTNKFIIPESSNAYII